MDVVLKSLYRDFEDLKEGDIFSYNDSFYMKIKESYDKFGNMFNAIEVIKNEIEVFQPTKKVAKVNAKLVIE